MESKRRFLLLVVMIALTVNIFAGSTYAIDPEIVVGTWFFDEGGGDTARDSSGNEHRGEVLGNVNWVAGKFGSALEFPGGFCINQRKGALRDTHTGIALR